jgi:hypothetical protein
MSVALAEQNHIKTQSFKQWAVTPVVIGVFAGLALYSLIGSNHTNGRTIEWKISKSHGPWSGGITSESWDITIESNWSTHGRKTKKTWRKSVSDMHARYHDQKYTVETTSQTMKGPYIILEYANFPQMLIYLNDVSICVRCHYVIFSLSQRLSPGLWGGTECDVRVKIKRPCGSLSNAVQKWADTSAVVTLSDPLKSWWEKFIRNNQQ